MPINKVAVQSIIDRIPAELRTAARQERQALIAETKKDPISASFRAAKGQVPFYNNVELKEKLSKVNEELAEECYANFSKPTEVTAAAKDIDVVKASSIL